MRKFASIAALSLVATCFMGASMAQAADPTKGKEIFMKYQCSSCHGTVGQGANTGPKLAPDPIPLDAMKNFVRNTTGQMPAYTETILNDADFADIHAYLSTIPKTQDYKTIPLLNLN
jgi:mono/diheme cytochrome c family protein